MWKMRWTPNDDWQHTKVRIFICPNSITNFKQFNFALNHWVTESIFNCVDYRSFLTYMNQLRVTTWIPSLFLKLVLCAGVVALVPVEVLCKANEHRKRWFSVARNWFHFTAIVAAACRHLTLDFLNALICFHFVTWQLSWMKRHYEDKNHRFLYDYIVIIYIPSHFTRPQNKWRQNVATTYHHHQHHRHN